MKNYENPEKTSKGREEGRSWYIPEGLSEYREANLFLGGIVPLIGYRSDYVYYDRHERFAGESKYPLKKMLSFAMDGVTSFSV